MKGIHYKDVIAMPGSELHKYLSEGLAEKAKKCYDECIQRYNKLMKEKS